MPYDRTFVPGNLLATVVVVVGGGGVVPLSIALIYIMNKKMNNMNTGNIKPNSKTVADTRIR